MIDGLGAGYLCHDLDVRTWHSAARVDGIARNASHIAICYIGNDRPSTGQMYGLAQAILWCERQLDRVLDIEGHQDADLTQCPGTTWPTWRHELLAALSDIEGTVVP